MELELGALYGNRETPEFDAPVVDWDAGIIGGQDFYDDKRYSFVRFICLPMDQINDLDLVGIEYQDVFPEEFSHGEHPSKPDTYALVISDDDPRFSERYDAARFFARFEKYGVTRTLATPREEDLGEKAETNWESETLRDEWKNPWGGIFIFPLDQSNE